MCAQKLGGVRGYSAGRKDLRIKGVKHTIAVASGKGGVGKSTTAGMSFGFWQHGFRLHVMLKGMSFVEFLGVLALWVMLNLSKYGSFR